MMNSPNNPISSPSRTTQQKHSSPIVDAPAPPNENASSSSSQKGFDTTLSEPFASFSHQNVLVRPYDDELRRDIGFQEQLHQLLLELVLEFHAWSTSRPDSESVSAGDALFEETQTIMNAELEQESSRVRLLEFITRIKAALAALTGFGL